MAFWANEARDSYVSRFGGPAVLLAPAWRRQHMHDIVYHCGVLLKKHARVRTVLRLRDISTVRNAKPVHEFPFMCCHPDGARVQCQNGREDKCTMPHG